MKSFFFMLSILFSATQAFADLKYYPVQFEINTDKESYYEGEKITFLITVTNTDKENSYPVLLPHTQNVGQKLFYLNLYDRANNTLLLRATEDRMLQMMVHDTGTVAIRYLKPQEKLVLKIYLNDSENYFNYQTQNSSHHSFGAPLFAGVYKIQLNYNPKGIVLGDSIYSYYEFFHSPTSDTKLAMDVLGQSSNMIELRIKRSPEKVVSIERNKYFVKFDGHRYWYFSEDVEEIISDLRLIHVTNLPPDSCSLENEYYYSHFTHQFAEYINRFTDGDIREYRKYRDECPDYLYTEKYNEFKQKTYYATQLPDSRFYSMSYGQPGNKPHQETYCSADGTLCNVSTFVYNKKGELIKTKVSQTQPCIEIEQNGEKRSFKKGIIEIVE